MEIYFTERIFECLFFCGHLFSKLRTSRHFYRVREPHLGSCIYIIYSYSIKKSFYNKLLHTQLTMKINQV